MVRRRAENRHVRPSRIITPIHFTELEAKGSDLHPLMIENSLFEGEAPLTSEGAELSLEHQRPRS
jgi:hypothetical protein